MSSEDIQAKSYQRRFFAFLDILGFSAFVSKGALNESDVIKAVKSVYAEIAENIAEEKTDDDGFQKFDVQLSIFSDSIMLSVVAGDNEDDQLQAVQRIAWCINKVVVSLLSSGFLVRGALLDGDILHDDSIVLGPALIKAYGLEVSVANVPRVIVSGKARSLLRQVGDNWIIPDEDGPYYLHTLKILEGTARSHSEAGWKVFSSTSGFRLLHHCRDTICAMLDNSRENPKHYHYNKWFALYFDRTVRSSGPVDQGGWIKKIVDC